MFLNISYIENSLCVFVRVFKRFKRGHGSLDPWPLCPFLWLPKKGRRVTSQRMFCMVPGGAQGHCVLVFDAMMLFCIMFIFLVFTASHDKRAQWNIVRTSARCVAVFTLDRCNYSFQRPNVWSSTVTSWLCATRVKCASLQSRWHYFLFQTNTWSKVAKSLARRRLPPSWDEKMA